MSLVQRIETDIATSMKEGIAARTAVLRLIKTSLKNEQIRLGRELEEAEALKVFQKEAKQRRDSIDQYTKGGRQDLADSEAHELTIIEAYLPQQMPEDELRKLVDEVVTETNATSMAEMGVVIGAVMKRAKGRADGGAVSKLVKERLQ